MAVTVPRHVTFVYGEQLRVGAEPLRGSIGTSLRKKERLIQRKGKRFYDSNTFQVSVALGLILCVFAALIKSVQLYRVCSLSYHVCRVQSLLHMLLLG